MQNNCLINSRKNDCQQAKKLQRLFNKQNKDDVGSGNESNIEIMLKVKKRWLNWSVNLARWRKTRKMHQQTGRLAH